MRLCQTSTTILLRIGIEIIIIMLSEIRPAVDPQLRIGIMKVAVKEVASKWWVGEPVDSSTEINTAVVTAILMNSAV